MDLHLLPQVIKVSSQAEDMDEKVLEEVMYGNLHVLTRMQLLVKTVRSSVGSGIPKAGMRIQLVTTLCYDNCVQQRLTFLGLQKLSWKERKYWPSLDTCGLVIARKIYTRMQSRHFIRDTLCEKYIITTLDNLYEGVLCIKCISKECDHIFLICVCYLSPEKSTRNSNPDEFYDTLLSQIFMYQNHGTFYVCGDFNGR